MSAPASWIPRENCYPGTTQADWSLCEEAIPLAAGLDDHPTLDLIHDMQASPGWYGRVWEWTGTGPDPRDSPVPIVWNEWKDGQT